MAKRRLRRDEFIDRYGEVQKHSRQYMERQRQLQRRMALGGGALAIVLLVLAAAGLRGKARAQAGEDAAQQLFPMEGVTVAAEDAEITLIEATRTAEEAVEELPEPIPAETAPVSATDPLRFYKGYEVYADAATREITDEAIISSYGVLIDLADGHIVAQRAARERMYPASMTKVLTVLTASELVSDLDERFTMTQEITDYVWRHDCSAVGYLPGEEITLRELFYGTILPSGGDAACALAYHTCGSIEAFADKMNEKLQELGLAGQAHFTNPAGVYDEENYCTPVAMAMIMKAALENELCAEVLGTRIYRTEPTEQHPEGIEISNWFIRRIEDKDTHGTVLGAKTGFINESGNCAVSYLRSESGDEYICVTGNAWSAWRAIYDHVAIYDAYVE